MAQDTELRRHKRGGIYFDDFVVGHLYEHPLTRTVTQMDNMLFSNMTLNPQPLHIDRHFCEQETEWGQPLMSSLLFVPADDAKKLDKAMASGADALIVDLEDSIPTQGKADARRSAAAFIADAAKAVHRPRLLVRVNGFAS